MENFNLPITKLNVHVLIKPDKDGDCQIQGGKKQEYTIYKKLTLTIKTHNKEKITN